jgi:alpha-N-acetylglucosaminidase
MKRSNNNSRRIWLIVILFFTSVHCYSQSHNEASEALIRRILPDHANNFVIERLEDTDDRTFEVESKGDKVVLRGNNGVSIASALYYYIKEVLHGQVTWNGVNVKIPDSLPMLQRKVRKTSPYEYRYYLNYCTFNYSMSWWDWDRWEQEIDWMVLHGINMPLAITGQEYVWQQVYRELGFSNEDIERFFSGPAYFAWFWMGNLDGWGGPLPEHWIESHKTLQQKILQRQRALGMKPVLPAFTGHVPPSFAKYFPNAKLKKTNWGNGFSDTYILDAEDPLFAEIGRRFLTKQTEVYGTDHLYSADTFNENEPPSDDPQFLSALSRKVYDGMKSVDAQATWVMQGWLFYSDREFWKPAQIKALLDAVPDNHMIILDLASEIEPVWKRTEAFYNKPWIWNMLHNFGGNTAMFGRLDLISTAPAEAIHDPSSGKLSGIGLTMEAIEQNPVLYELMTDHVWNDKPFDADQWLRKYIRQRYGSENAYAIETWRILRTTVYNGKDIRDGAESMIAARPTLESGRRWVKTKLNYEREALHPAWDAMIKAIPSCKNFEGFRYDLVDITRQVMANYATVLHTGVVKAYRERNSAAFKALSENYIALMDDLDALLATRRDFLLGPWIRDARQCGITAAEKALYERNAKNLITLWGDENNRLHEYSCRQWSGLIKDFYKPRWQQFFKILQEDLEKGEPADLVAFESQIKKWEWAWVTTEKQYPVKTNGDEVATVIRMHRKYRNVIEGIRHK